MLADFKARAAAAKSVDDMWAFVEQAQAWAHEIDETFDYRYSRLLPLFGQLLRDGCVQRSQLEGLSDEKQAYLDNDLGRRGR